MFKLFIITLFAIISFLISSCSSQVGGLRGYVNSGSGYQFLYPNGWLQVDVKNASEGVNVVFRDLIERSENLSVIISEVKDNKTLTDLGTPTEVGYRFLKQVNNNSRLKQETEFINAQSHEADGKTYYIFEYQVKLPDNQERHNLASVAVSRGKLFTFNLSTTQQRWQKVKNLFESVVNSFSVY